MVCATRWTRARGSNFLVAQIDSRAGVIRPRPCCCCLYRILRKRRGASGRNRPLSLALDRRGLCPQHLLVELANRSLGKFSDEADLVGEPPTRDLVIEE